MTADVAAARANRHRWLDALRGLAVLAVVFDHVAYLAFHDAWTALMGTWHPGAFGVALIFLVTGYLIPASLARGGRAGRFWVSRVFRLYPLWTAMAVGALALGLLGWAPLPAELWDQPATVLLANSSLLQSLLDVPALLPLLWTLSYQIAFYLLVTASYRLDVHRHAAWIAVVLGVLALLATAAGWLTGPIGLPRTGWFVATVLVLLAAGLWAALHRARPVATVGAVALILMVLALAARDQHTGGWSLAGLAMMFTGAASYQARRDRRGWSGVAIALGTVFAAVAATAWGSDYLATVAQIPGAAAAQAWFVGLLTGVLTFLAAPLLSPRLIPRRLAGVGEVSYSVYLLHFGVILVFLPWLEAAGRAAWWWQAAAFAVLLAVLLPACRLTYRLVEVPGQRLGRALLRRSEPPAPDAASAPVLDPPDLRVSVVIPNYNKAKTLRACLAAVYAQTCPPAEVIVVDDASTDGSRAIAAEFPCRVLAFEANRGISAARNAGAAAAGGDVLFFLDSDIGLAPNALEVAVRLLQQRPECAVVQGIYDWRPLFADSRVEDYKTLSEHFWRRQGVGDSNATLFALTAIRRHVFDEVGGFDESLAECEDLEFGTRLPRRHVIVTSAEIVGRHDDVDRFWPYLTEHVRRAHRYGGLVVRGLLAPAGAGARRHRTDVAAAASMAACVLAVATLPLALVAGWLLLVPVVLVAGFVALDRALFGFVWRQRGVVFLGYVVAMQFLMYTTQCVGMCTGAVVGALR